MFLKKFVCGPLENNVIFLACANTLEAAVVDPGISSFSYISSFLEENQYRLKKIFLTHSHWDHIADLHHFRKKYDLEIYIHPSDKENVEKPGSDGLTKLISIPAVSIDHYISDKEMLTLGDLKLEVLHTPGHTLGSVCYYIKKEKLLFSGDTFFKGSMGRVDFPNSSVDLMWKSLKRLSKLPKETHVIPGHGSETSIGSEEWLSEAKDFFS